MSLHVIHRSLRNRGPDQAGMSLLLAAFLLLGLALGAAALLGRSSLLQSGSTSRQLTASRERNDTKNAGQAWASAFETAVLAGADPAAAPYLCSASGSGQAADPRDATISHSCREVPSGSANPAKKAFLITSSRASGERSSTLVKLQPAAVCQGGATSPTAYGSGTEADPYLICSAAQLDAIRGNHYKYFKLTNDIDLSTLPTVAGSNFHMIVFNLPVSGTGFAGIDGDGHAISNLKLSTGPSNYGVGLVASAQGPANSIVLKNLRLVNVDVAGTAPIAQTSWVGALAGFLGVGGTIVSGIHVTGTVSSTGFVGGVIGRMGSTGGGSLITDVHFDGQVNSVYQAGGIINLGLFTTIRRSSTKGTLNLTGSYTQSQTTYLVGVAGGIAANYLDGIHDSFSTMDITSPSKAALGGIVGACMSDMRNSYYAGRITSGGNTVGAPISVATKSGGAVALFGTNPQNCSSYPAGAVVKTFWDTQVSTMATSDQGVGKTTSEMKDPATYAGWDSAIWNIRAGEYPTLR